MIAARFSRPLAACIVAAAGLLPVSAGLAQSAAAPEPCAVLAGKEVAALVKGRLLHSPSGGPKTCTYLVELAGGEVESYRFFILRAAEVEALLRAQSVAERGQPLAGLLDEAWLQPPVPGGGGHTVLALRRGGIAVEMTGPRKEVLQALAKTVAPRLK